MSFQDRRVSPRSDTSLDEWRTESLPLLKSHFPSRSTDLPDQWLQRQASGSNVCRVLRGGMLAVPPAPKDSMHGA